MITDEEYERMMEKMENIEYVTHPMVYRIYSPNIWSTLHYTSYDKVLEKMKEFENLAPMDGSDGKIIIEFLKNGKLAKNFNEDTQELEW